VKTLPAGITEGQTLTADLEVGCDLAVIGSGAGGAVMAAFAAQAGLSVVLLEEGGAFGVERFRQREDEAYPFLYQDGGQRATKDGAIAILQGRALGGGTTVNWTTCFRTPDYIVEHWRTKHAVGGVSGVHGVQLGVDVEIEERDAARPDSCHEDPPAGWVG
jgi:choline dehydrogenase-like flavoprotein